MQVIKYRIGVSQVICLVLAGKYLLENKPNLTSTGHTGPPILTAYNVICEIALEKTSPASVQRYQGDRNEM